MNKYIKKLLTLTSFLLCGLIAGCGNSDSGIQGELDENRDPFSCPTIFVDIKGSEEGDGSYDAPCKTISKAQKLARELKKLHPNEQVAICLRGGCYYLSEPIKLTCEDSGIRYEVMPGEHASISGGVEISGWTLFEASRNIWVADAGDVISRDFFVAGKRAIRARAESNPVVVACDENSVTVSNAELKNLSNPSLMEFIIHNMWTQSRIRAVSSTTQGDQTTFIMAQPGWKTYYETAGLGGAAFQPSQLVSVENAYEFLTEAGEWFLDETHGKVYYIPREGEILAETECVLGALEHLVEFSGNASNVVADVTFRGITFSHTTWLRANENGGLLTIQANFYKKTGVTPQSVGNRSNWIAPTAALEGAFMNQIKIDACSFVHLGGGAVAFGRGTQNTVISSNTFTDVGGTAILLGGFADSDHNPIMNVREYESEKARFSLNNQIVYNRIDNVACVYQGGVGISVGYVGKTQVSHNTITNLPYTAISFGWGWGHNGAELRGEVYEDADGKNLFSDNQITYNYISDIMKVLFDGGGIYTLGRMDGMLISDNYIEKVNNDYGAIYLDDGSQGITVRNNVISNAYRNFIYKGDYNYIQNNYVTIGTAKQPNFDLRTPLVAGEYHYAFENNDKWDQEKAMKIREAAGVKTDN